jgi:hypothetical protein
VPVSALPNTTLVPCVIDLYTAMMFLSSDMQSLLTMLNLPISPKVMVTSTPDNLSLAYIVAHSSNLFITKSSKEVKEWQALLNFLNNQVFYTSGTSDTDPYNHAMHFKIPDSKYGAAATANTLNACRVNHP